MIDDDSSSDSFEELSASLERQLEDDKKAAAKDGKRGSDAAAGKVAPDNSNIVKNQFLRSTSPHQQVKQSPGEPPKMLLKSVPDLKYTIEAEKDKLVLEVKPEDNKTDVKMKLLQEMSREEIKGIFSLAVDEITFSRSEANRLRQKCELYETNVGHWKKKAQLLQEQCQLLNRAVKRYIVTDRRQNKRSVHVQVDPDTTAVYMQKSAQNSEARFSVWWVKMGNELIWGNRGAVMEVCQRDKAERMMPLLER